MNTDLGYFFKFTHEFSIPDVFKDISKPWEALRNSKKLLNEILVEKNVTEMFGEAKGKVHFYNQYSVGKGTVLYNDVTIIGPVIIGEDCEIMPGAVIRPGTIIGNGCIAGHGCEIKNSIIQNYAKVQSLTFVGDSVLGKAARVGSGVIVANRKFNQSNVTVKTDEGILDLGTSFFGCILGDNARLGANSVTQPGTLIGPYTWIYPMTNVRGSIPAAKRVYHEKPILMEDNEMLDLDPHKGYES